MSDHVAGDGRRSAAISGAVEPETYEASDVRDHLVELDALRGIAILGVVGGHLASQWYVNVGPLTVPGLGWDALDLLHFMRGVPLFFLLSGYLLAWTEGNRARRGSYSLRSYALRRVLRIVPAYYVAILVVLLVWPSPTSLPDLLSHLAFVHGFTPGFARTMSSAFWSLTPEVVFYCMLPFIVLKLPRLWHRLALFVGLLLVSLPTQILLARNAGEQGNMTYGEFNPFQFYASFPTTLLFLFAAGALLRTLVERLNERPASSLQPYAALALFLGSAAYLLAVSGRGEGEMALGPSLLSYLALVGFFASAVLGAPVLRGLLKWRLLSLIGLVSYSMFLFHQTVLMLVSRHVLRDDGAQDWITQNGLTMWSSFLAYLLFVCATVGAVSYLGYRYVESPFLRIKPK